MEKSANGRWKWSDEEWIFLLAWIDFCRKPGNDLDFKKTIVSRLMSRYPRHYTWNSVKGQLRKIILEHTSNKVRNLTTGLLISQGSSVLNLDKDIAATLQCMKEDLEASSANSPLNRAKSQDTTRSMAELTNAEPAISGQLGFFIGDREARSGTGGRSEHPRFEGASNAGTDIGSSSTGNEQGAEIARLRANNDALRKETFVMRKHIAKIDAKLCSSREETLEYKKQGEHFLNMLRSTLASSDPEYLERRNNEGCPAAQDLSRLRIRWDTLGERIGKTCLDLLEYHPGMVGGVSGLTGLSTHFVFGRLFGKPLDGCGVLLEHTTEIIERTTPWTVARALTGAALTTTVFASSFPDFGDSILLDAHMKVEVISGASLERIRARDHLVYDQIFKSLEFRTRKLPMDLATMTAQVLQLLRPFTRLQAIAGRSGGETTDFRHLCRESVEIAISLKTELLVSRKTYAIMLPQPGDSFDETLMKAERADGEPLTLGRGDTAVVRLCLFPALIEYPEAEPLSSPKFPSGDFSEVLVKGKRMFQIVSGGGGVGVAKVVSPSIVLVDVRKPDP